MKTYKMLMVGAGLAALTQIGCAAGTQAAPEVASQDSCSVASQNMRPQWKMAAVRTAPSDAVFRPGVTNTDARQQVAAQTFHPELRETNVVSACVETRQQTY